MAKHSGRQDDRPAMLFYVNDWLGSADLRLCSLAARGLWIDLLCVMHTAEKRGFLQANGSKLEANDIAKLVSAPEAEVKQAVSNLERWGVFSRDGEGSIYCRRMVKESGLSSKRAAAGRKGGLASKLQAKPQATHGMGWVGMGKDGLDKTGMDTRPAPGVDAGLANLDANAVRFWHWLRDERGVANGRPWANHCNEAFMLGVPLQLAKKLYDKHGVLDDPWEFNKRLIREWRQAQREQKQVERIRKLRQDAKCRICGREDVPGVWDGGLCPQCRKQAAEQEANQ